MKWDFRDKDDIGASGDPGLDGNPSGVPAHDFGDHDTVMAFCRSVQPVDAFGSGIQRRIKTESIIGSRKIVIYSFGNAYDVRYSIFS